MKQLVTLLALVALTAPEVARAACSPPADPRFAARVERALRAKRDVWGEELLASPAGPTYDSVRRYLPPLLYGRAAKRTRLTESGVHYVAFSRPSGPHGAGSVVLHVADGSQLISQRADGARLTVRVGAGGGERYGACLGRLTTPRLRNRWLPALRSSYVDALGVRYRQESFAAPFGRAKLAGLVELVVDARGASRTATVRFESSRSALAFSVRPGGVRTAFVAWPVGATPGRPRLIGRRVYSGARESLTRYWERRLAEGLVLEVPERRVMDAQRAILVQNLGLTWRYSIGNAYEQFSFPEGVDVAQDEQLWPRERRAIDPTHVVDATDAPLPELEDGPEARRVSALLPPLPGPKIRCGGDARPPRLRHRARPAARGERTRDPPA